MAMTQDDIAKANVQQKYLQATAGGALGTGTLAPSWLAGWAGWLAVGHHVSVAVSVFMRLSMYLWACPCVLLVDLRRTEHLDT